MEVLQQCHWRMWSCRRNWRGTTGTTKKPQVSCASGAPLLCKSDRHFWCRKVALLGHFFLTTSTFGHFFHVEAAFWSLLMAILVAFLVAFWSLLVAFGRFWVASRRFLVASSRFLVAFWSLFGRFLVSSRRQYSVTLPPHVLLSPRPPPPISSSSVPLLLTLPPQSRPPNSSSSVPTPTPTQARFVCVYIGTASWETAVTVSQFFTALSTYRRTFIFVHFWSLPWVILRDVDGF